MTYIVSSGTLNPTIPYVMSETVRHYAVNKRRIHVVSNATNHTGLLFYVLDDFCIINHTL